MDRRPEFEVGKTRACRCVPLSERALRVQFYLNGFYPGDPCVSPAADDRAPGPPAQVPVELDVLIVGCGPAGLTLAAQMSAFPEIRTAIFEQKPGPLEIGQADGIACRSVEMYQAFGFAARVMEEGYWVNETTFWKPDEHAREKIARSGRIQDTEDGLSEFPHLILNQARVHDFLLDVMRDSPTRLEPYYARRLVELTIDRGAGDYPVTARFERLDDAHKGSIETVRARYVVGCDGARSFVRGAIGRELRGDSANQAWGVMDVLATTDFPDIRMKSAIHSAKEGNILIIPREGGYMVRLYIELDKLAANERVASRNITSDDLVAAAKRILHPYTLEVKEVAWWSVYEIGQRISDKFDDVPEDAGDMLPCAFIAGDACHTHSPKAGQGMNVSIADGFNLGWKLGAVLRGQAKPELLHSYSRERRAIAQELIDFDREFAKMFSAPPKDSSDPSATGIDPLEFQRYFVKHGRFTAGTSVHYGPSSIVGAGDRQALAEGFTVGMRFHSAPAIRLADAKPMHLGHVVRADGRWRLFAFAPSEASSSLTALSEFLAKAASSPVRKYTPIDADPDSVIETIAVLQRDFRDVELEAIPAFLVPPKGRYGLRDYEKVFCPDLKSGQDLFDMRGIDRERGCLVIVRPDQFVADVLPFDAHAELGAFFDRIFQPPG
jgi:phenol 2-monooxygenase